MIFELFYSPTVKLLSSFSFSLLKLNSTLIVSKGLMAVDVVSDGDMGVASWFEFWIPTLVK